MKKVVGNVTEEEKLDILEINGHKNSLEELLLILPRASELYCRASNDLRETEVKYQKWWDDHYNKYHWEKGKGDWKIIFETNEIIIES